VSSLIIGAVCTSCLPLITLIPRTIAPELGRSPDRSDVGLGEISTQQPRYHVGMAETVLTTSVRYCSNVYTCPPETHVELVGGYRARDREYVHSGGIT
jgi:hypothetical protein